jgi:hypothetical protein
MNPTEQQLKKIGEFIKELREDRSDPTTGKESKAWSRGVEYGVETALTFLCGDGERLLEEATK